MPPAVHRCDREVNAPYPSVPEPVAGAPAGRREPSEVLKVVAPTVTLTFPEWNQGAPFTAMAKLPGAAAPGTDSVLRAPEGPAQQATAVSSNAMSVGNPPHNDVSPDNLQLSYKG